MTLHAEFFWGLLIGALGMAILVVVSVALVQMGRERERRELAERYPGVILPVPEQPTQTMRP